MRLSQCPARKKQAVRDRADRRASHPETEHDNDEKLPMLSFIVDCSCVFGFVGSGGGLTVMSTCFSPSTAFDNHLSLQHHAWQRLSRDMSKNMAQKRSQVHFDRYLWHDWLGSSVVHNKKRFLRQVSSASEASVLISPRAPLPSKVKCNFNQLVSASFRFVLNASRDELHTHRPISGELITTLCVKWAGDKCQTLLLPAAVIFYFALCRRLFHNGSLNWNKLPGDDDDLASAAATARSPHFSNQFKKPFSNHISDSELSLRL